MTEEKTIMIQKAMDLAIQHHNAGNLSKAETIYQQILEARPNQPTAFFQSKFYSTAFRK